VDSTSKTILQAILMVEEFGSLQRDTIVGAQHTLYWVVVQMKKIMDISAQFNLTSPGTSPTYFKGASSYYYYSC
jgi:hypothetical protein